MKEIKDIAAAFDEAQKQGKQAALATVVHVDGSSYRRPGARMLITEDGQLTGAISGGCLEGDALRKALLVMNRKKSMLVTYDTNEEDDAAFGAGLGCNGIIQVLIEPVNADDPVNAVELLKKTISRRRAAVFATVFSLQHKREAQQGTCLLAMEDVAFLTGTDIKDIREVLLKEANQVLMNKKSSFKNYDSENRTHTVFFEYIKPPVSLIVVGAGNDVMPMVAMAGILGWQITVIDGRSTHAKKERFLPECQVLLSKPEDLLKKIDIDDQTAFVLMTHNYHYDLAVLRELIKTKVPYIGSLGPKKKLNKMVMKLEEEGFLLDSEQLKHVYGPSGLDIGAETPEEIALSILSEIKAVLSNKQGNMLRDKPDPIHLRNETLIEKITTRHT
ncbi:MAG: XdhC family protein [Bacteroidetes bacterium]|nr:XdhC family protein [Bacteroidota bacterium]MBS1974713.1 XdhC family protein [Bacteroidota bacterium]